MHPRDEEHAMAAAEGVVYGTVIGVVMSVGIVAAISAFGDPLLRYATWTVAVLVESAR